MNQFVEVIDNVLPPALCQALIGQIDSSPNRQAGRTGGGVDTDKKVSEDVSIMRHPEFGQLLPQVLQHTTARLMDYFARYYFALIGPIGLTVKHPQTGQPVKVTQDNFEEVARPNLQNLVQYLFRLGDINAQKYPHGRGGYPYWHSEVYPQTGSNDALHRILLFMFYLNDVAEGGETDFYYQDLSIKPRAGRMVIAPAYFTHTHRGNVPVSNDKYILTSWVLFNPAEKIYTG
ncbi:2OG-Fe(II) oxygenase [Bowmanella dokdonensis]|uniref:2OG-Fe(II) oxygenase n=1 Tax=Bowmanella dokdonensis TaxID=751969 RepID=A0A939DPL7_9ALTE|nr:2OG-Fe(II) oxygenase [Bowmanella dokdonensis]MBN7826047.1 2OG-Fe(II) oxygenase [Bowmanella dokdonensis]